MNRFISLGFALLILGIIASNPALACPLSIAESNQAEHSGSCWDKSDDSEGNTHLYLSVQTISEILDQMDRQGRVNREELLKISLNSLDQYLGRSGDEMVVVKVPGSNCGYYRISSEGEMIYESLIVSSQFAGGDIKCGALKRALGLGLTHNRDLYAFNRTYYVASGGLDSPHRALAERYRNALRFAAIMGVSESRRAANTSNNSGSQTIVEVPSLIADADSAPKLVATDEIERLFPDLLPGAMSSTALGKYSDSSIIVMRAPETVRWSAERGKTTSEYIALSEGLPSSLEKLPHNLSSAEFTIARAVDRPELMIRYTGDGGSKHFSVSSELTEFVRKYDIAMEEIPEYILD
ncbi:hypothetical protein [Sulfitobacter dubius]|uniref:hypothetical protein n=1 Tax=Sulfitobacter dubius TaxID=218673 RepID=UPI0008E519D6|nr:hypothetical protein [Sulfitobacter dubius]SFG69130.1 hypothetical protein SAMN04488039_1011680 [Sulfitobacter dubius]